MNKKNTGYPHIDKPWMKYYEGVKISQYPYDMNFVDYIRSKDHYGSSVALSYYGKEITYDELFENIGLSSRALRGIGVSKGDRILCLVANIPEAGETFLGATQIGAVCDFIDPRPDSADPIVNSKKVLEIIKREKPKYIFALDLCYVNMIKPIENEIKDLGVQAIIITSPQDSMDLLAKIDYFKDVLKYAELKGNKSGVDTSSVLAKLRMAKDCYSDMMRKQKEFNKLLASYISHTKVPVYDFVELKKACRFDILETVHDIDLINYIGHTSGTSSSMPKPIALTNRNAISSVEQCIKADATAKKGETALHILPYFAPFGTFNNYLENLGVGATNIEVPEFQFDEFGYLMKKYKPNVLMCTPTMLLSIMNNDYLDEEDLSYLTMICYGGDSMTREDEEKLNNWLRAHGSKVEVSKGHGMSEFCGAGSYAQKDYNKPESIGIPLPDTIYSIVDPNVENKLVPLKFSSDKEFLEGEIVVSSSHVTSGMLDDEVIVPHFEMDGKSYIRTRDIGRMDRDGIFYIDGRKDRSFMRYDGFKIKPFEVESEIDNHPLIKYAKVVDYFDEDRNGLMPICHIVPNDDVSLDDIELIEKIVYDQIINNEKMVIRQVPSKFKIRDNMPLTKNGKVDYNALKNEGVSGDEINVFVEESNLKTGDIKIYKNKKNKERIRK